MLRISVVTPTFNSEAYFRETILSVIHQSGDFEIEYIVKDGGSTDKTKEIFDKYDHQIRSKAFPISCRGVSMRWESRADKGMYSAINKGFALATGDVFCWINSDDIYLPGALSRVAQIMTSLPKVQWCKGITSYLDDQSNLTKRGDLFLYSQALIRKGIYGVGLPFIQQDSVFWRRELWHKQGPIDENLKLAGDYYLWHKFAEVTPLYCFNQEVSMFRRRSGQLSENLDKYFAECHSICPGNESARADVQLYMRREKRVPRILKPLFFQMYFRTGRLPTIDIQSRPRIRHLLYYKYPVHEPLQMVNGT